MNRPVEHGAGSLRRLSGSGLCSKTKEGYMDKPGFHYVTIKYGKKGKQRLRFHTSWSSSSEAAVEMVCNVEKCPRSAVVSVRRTRKAPVI